MFPVGYIDIVEVTSFWNQENGIREVGQVSFSFLLGLLLLLFFSLSFTSGTRERVATRGLIPARILLGPLSQNVTNSFNTKPELVGKSKKNQEIHLEWIVLTWQNYKLYQSFDIIDEFYSRSLSLPLRHRIRTSLFI